MKLKVQQVRAGTTPQAYGVHIDRITGSVNGQMRRWRVLSDVSDSSEVERRLMQAVAEMLNEKAETSSHDKRFVVATSVDRVGHWDVLPVDMEEYAAIRNAAKG